MSKKQPEYTLQKQICKWLERQHPQILFVSDTVASVRLTIPQQVRNKAIQKKDFSCPDLMIFASRGGYNGLFIELKTDTPFKKDGDLKRQKRSDGKLHLHEQAKALDALQKEGYYACFAWSFDMATEIISKYLSAKLA